MVVFLLFVSVGTSLDTFAFSYYVSIPLIAIEVTCVAAANTLYCRSEKPSSEISPRARTPEWCGGRWCNW